MSFGVALSGLNAASADLKVISNNIANGGTTGFKKARAEFADVYAMSNLGVTSNAIGSGVKTASVSQQFTQGNIGYTNNNLDLAISGQGFFQLSDNGVYVYTRAGTFSVDKDGYVANSQNQRLTAFQADASGNITGAQGDLHLDTSDIAPSASTAVTAGLNLNAADKIPVQPVATTTVTSADALNGGAAAGTTVTNTATIYDSYGVSHSAVITYTKQAAANTWATSLTVDGVAVGAGSANLVFSGSPGALSTPATGTVTFPAYTPSSGAPAMTLAYNFSGATQAAATTTSAMTANGTAQSAFDPTIASTYNSSTSLTVYDSLGGSHLASLYYRKTGIPNQWQTWSYIDGTQASGPDLMAFKSDGTLDKINGTLVPPSIITIPTYNLNNGSSALNITVDYSKITQYGSPFSVNTLSQDGYATGRLSGIDISNNGIVQARFTNGRTRTLGQVVLANFNNPQGLRQLGDTNWAETYESGSGLAGTPGSGTLGLIQSGALEGSNVDMTEQLVSMITAQRNFQANAQVITTDDNITQTIINIRR